MQDVAAPIQKAGRTSASNSGREEVDRREAALLEALRARDEHAFRDLVTKHHRGLVRTARMYVKTEAVAEEVVQETWVGVLQGIGRFEGRSSLKSWIYSILLNRAKTRGIREQRTIPFSALADPVDGEAAAVEPERFLDASHPRWPHHWTVPPRSWGASPEEKLLSEEGRSVLLEAIGRLPAAYREVLTLRDVNGLSSKEVCNILAISETNQRVLLHRARSRVRRMVERYFDREGSR